MDEIPTAVLALKQFACAHGWKVKMQCAQGRLPHGRTGVPLAERESVALRFEYGDRSAYAMNVEGTWKSIWIWGKDIYPFGDAGVTHLKEYLVKPDLETDEVMAWLREIREGLEEDAAERKKREACNRGNHGSVRSIGALRRCDLCKNGWDEKSMPWRKPVASQREHA